MGFDPRIELAVGDITKLTRSTPSSTRPTARCLAAAASMAPSTARLAASCSPNAARSAAARPARLELTRGYRLPARFVIHTVGPVWRGGASNEDALLAGCYRSSLALAAAHEVRSIAFPAISTGVYGFPRSRACAIAVNETHHFLLKDATLERVIFISFDAETDALYRRELGLA